MSVRRTWLLGLAVALVAAVPARADKLDKESKKWLEEVRAIILPDERETYSKLKDRGERAAFEEIFWARRDPDPSTPANEYKAEFETRKAEADKRYRVAGTTGSATDCGRLYVLLGEPDEVKQETRSENRGLRLPETWIYKSRPNMNFTGGQALIQLDADCRFQVPAVAEQLDRVGSSFIANPNLGYKVRDGRITRLADLLPKPSPAQTLLKEPREDFTLTGQSGYMHADGATVLMGLVKVDGAALTPQDSGGTKTAAVTVAAQALNADGASVASEERSIVAEIGADGSAVTAYRLFLKPGKYTLRYGVVDDKSGRGAAKSEEIDVPDLNKGELSAASMFVVSEIVDVTGETDSKDPLGAFVLGKARLVPRFGNVFKQSEAPLFFYNVSDGAPDPETGKPRVTVGLSLSRGKSIVAKAPDQDFDQAYVASAVGPVPLQNYEPGTYTAKLKAHDNVADKDVTVEQNFEIVP